MATAIPLSKVRAMANMPDFVVKSIIDNTYNMDIEAGMALQAAYRLPKHDFNRMYVGEVKVQTGETVIAWIEGKFIFVEW